MQHSTPAKSAPTTPRRRSRIRIAHEAKILAAAEEVFAHRGFNGATLEAIAEQAGLSKQNLLYYFASKELLYQEVLKKIFNLWLDKLNLFNQHGDDPATMLENYIRGKLEISQSHPLGSKVFANEVINGAPHIRDYLKANLLPALEADVTLVRHWIAEGKIDDVDPYHLFFVIWASTQTYADFSAQIQLALGKSQLDNEDFQAAANFLSHVLLKGLGLSSPSS